MWIQYNISDGDLVSIQATNSKRVDDIHLLLLGREQYEVPDNTEFKSKVNIITGEIIIPEQVLSTHDEA